jgi:predicted NBD/HSP70 family sugar kinase
MTVGVDIGGSGTKACVVANGRIISTASVPTGAVDGDGLGDIAVSALSLALTEAGARLADIDSIGLGVPGQVSSGLVRHAANLGIGETGFDLGGYVSSATQVVTLVENDMRVAALGAYTQLAALDGALRSLIYIGLGTGVSAGVILDGNIYRGSRGLAGEIGHVPVGTDVSCVCGSVGCLETLVGASALRQGWDGETPSSVFKSAVSGNVRAQELADRVIEHLARAMWWLAAAYDPDLFFIGGGIGASTPSIRNLLAARWVEMAAPSALAQRVLDPGRIRMYDLEEPVGAFGAALLAAADGADRGYDTRKRSGRRNQSHE